MLLYLDKVKTNQSAFESKVNEIALLLKIDPNWLMMVMNSESGLNSKAVNKQKGDSDDPLQRISKRATGLIQFMPKTAEVLGTTTQKLYDMNPVNQLEYVYKYFQPFAGKYKSFFDLYAYTFYPAMVGKPDTWILGSQNNDDGKSAQRIADQNPGITKNENGLISVGSFKKWIEGKLKQSGQLPTSTDTKTKSSGTMPPNTKSSGTMPPPKKNNNLPLILGFGFLIYLAVK